MSDSLRVRFAPSPTGFLHVGGARTALFNWLHARRNGGKLVLRIEDTDKQRNTAEAVQVIYDGLNWLGIDWDEGPQKGGDHGPYFQSERNAIYEKHLATLEAAGVVYEDDGAIRFRSPRKPVTVVDEVCGSIEFDRAMEPDMTIRRPDGSWIFHFVNVVDDIEMQINTVIRGEDHLSNTPKHLELYAALGATPPKFAHIPLILNQDGSKMSKRDEGSSITTYIEQGYAPEAVINYLCLLGWSPKDNREKLDIEEVISLFDLSKINRRNAAFDLNKCFWLNGQYLLHMSPERFRELSVPWMKKAGIVWEDEAYLSAVLAIVQEKVKHLTDVPSWTDYFFTESYAFDPESFAKIVSKPEPSEKLKVYADACAALEDWNASALEASLKESATKIGCKVGEIVHPARVAVSGRAVGPSLYHMLEVLGKERVLQRFARGIEEFRKPATV